MRVVKCGWNDNHKHTSIDLSYYNWHLGSGKVASLYNIYNEQLLGTEPEF